MTVHIPTLPVSRKARQLLDLPANRFDRDGRLLIRSRKDAREIAMLYARIEPHSPPMASDIYGAAHIITAWRLLLTQYARSSQPYESAALKTLQKERDPGMVDTVLTGLHRDFPTSAVWHGQRKPGDDLLRPAARQGGHSKAIRVWTLVHLSQNDPAFAPFSGLFSSREQDARSDREAAWECIAAADVHSPPRAPENAPPLATMMKPILAAPHSVRDQLFYILTRWGSFLGDWTSGLLGALDMITEETQMRFTGPGPVQAPGFGELDGSPRFSRDDDWMPRVVLLAKNVLVWLHQLSVSSGRSIQTLDAIPDGELDVLASRGFNALWLIGLWERSPASREIKRRMNNPEAAASAYSLFDYEVAAELGGWEALNNLRIRCEARGIRLSSDMVPNHVGIDSNWVRNHPDRLLGLDDCPFPAYSFHGDDLSKDAAVDIRLEDHYWEKSDAAVVFRRVDRRTGSTRFIYHGNDGTSMPWNDTAQIDFLNPEAREAVMQKIIQVARNFPIIRFDAAMVLTRKHIRRLWFPQPGSGGAIPSRSEHALSDQDFLHAMPQEFWREVVDRVADEVPGTLLLAEAFWMMEGYFVRTLGMHRVYNSAFMNMLRDQKNSEYRAIIKETLLFDPGILQRFVNFMNNPDEETAIDQFGKDDKYFAVCTLLATLPGLPMVGHGQVEGLTEKYGMEYTRAYRDEWPDSDLIARHEREIFPLLARRSLFAGAVAFRLYDLTEGELVNPDVYAYTNSEGGERALVIVNNAFDRAVGSVHRAAPVNGGGEIPNTLADAIVPPGSGDGDWLLLRDFVSGLWYLRSVEVLQNEGLKVIVDGYGRQVFLDFNVVRESRDGAWGILASNLAGSGILDPEATVNQIRLQPIRSSLDALMPDNLVIDMARTLRRGGAPKWPENRAAAVEALTVIHQHHDRITDASSETRVDADSVLIMAERRLAGAARHWQLFGGSVRRVLNRRFTPPSGDEAVFLTAWSLLSALTALVDEDPQVAWDVWGLDEWLTGKAWANRAPELVRLVKAVLRLSWFLGKTAEFDLKVLFAHPVFQEACGVNTWDGTQWYNQEGWNDAVRSLALCAVAEGSRRRVWRRRVRRWKRADAAAAYRLDRLLEAVR